MLARLALAILSLLGALMTLTCNSAGRVVHPAASEISLEWELISNLQPEPGTLKASLTLINSSSIPLASKGWALYFNFARLILEDATSPEVEITHVNGDFYRLTPTERFPGLANGEALTVFHVARDWVIKECEAPAGFYFVFSDSEGRDQPPERVARVTVKPFMRPEQTSRGPGDAVEVPTAASAYRANQIVSMLPPETLSLIPSTRSRVRGVHDVELTPDMVIRFGEGLQREASYLVSALTPLLGTQVSTVAGAGSTRSAITLSLGEPEVEGERRQTGSEAYRLSISVENGVEIVGSDPAGVFYGIQTFRSLLPLDALRAPQASILVRECQIEDMPSFHYRGLHLDVGRNFQSKDSVKKLIELMAFYKLNKLHFHLTDDEGWRLEIAGLPELTEVGGKRGHTVTEEDRLFPSFGSGPDPDPSVSSGSGFYTRAEFVEILRHARDRHIEVIPEIDVPGHARAAIKSMERRYRKLIAEGNDELARKYLLVDLVDRSEYISAQGWTDNVINVCQDSTYAFLEAVVDDIVEIFREAEVELSSIHIGGDEVPQGVWEDSPVCDALRARGEVGNGAAAELSSYFTRRISEILSERGLTTAGWEEIALKREIVGGREVHTPDLELAGRDVRPYVWNSVWGWGGEENAYKLANAGFKVVICNASNLYFDLAYNKDPREPGYYWAGFVDTRTTFDFDPFELYRSATRDLMGRPINSAMVYGGATRLTDEGRNNLLGIQGQLWSENLKSKEELEHAAFPKLLALAERAWARQPAWTRIEEPEARRAAADQKWNLFANTLGQRELRRLDYLEGGVSYRISPPGAVIEEGLLKANVEFPGLTIRFTTDGSEPTMTSTPYTGVVRVTSSAKLKTFNALGRGSSTSETSPSE